MFRLKPLRILAIACLPMLGVAHAQSVQTATPPSVDPTTQWELSYGSGVFWHVSGMATHLDYVFLPQILTLESPAMIRPVSGHGNLVIRNRLAFLIEPIVQGPEHHYFGWNESPSVEWWNAARTGCLFASGGGGFGYIDAHGYTIPGGQATRFELNYFAYGGGRLLLTDTMDASLGLYFQHISNGHITKLDPGVNALGPLASLNWRF